MLVCLREDERKIHWVMWNKLLDRKVERGTCFNELQDFDTVLLAKTTWRPQSNPEALWVRVLKGMYYPNEGFWEARKDLLTSWF